MDRQQHSVCTSCKDGPWCRDIYLHQPVLEVEVGSPCANTTRRAHTAIQISAPGVPLYSENIPVLAQANGGECSRKVVEEEFNTNGGSSLEVEEGGSVFERRTSSEFKARQAIFRKCQEANNPKLPSFNF